MSKANLINAALFQLVWFGCVIGGGVHDNLTYAVVPLLLLILVRPSAELSEQLNSTDLLLVLLALPAGWVLDGAWIQLGVLDYGGVTTAPAWIMLMWVGVALTVNYSLSFFRDRPLLGALVVGVTAPVTYLAGERLGAVMVPDPVNLWMVSLAWALLFYLLFRVALARGVAASTAG